MHIFVVMEERLENMVFINICEACMLFYNANKYGFSTFHSWCCYHKNFITGKLTTHNKEYLHIYFYISDYLSEIYGFSDSDTLPLIYKFFDDERWGELYEIAELTLRIQKEGKF